MIQFLLKVNTVHSDFILIEYLDARFGLQFHNLNLLAPPLVSSDRPNDILSTRCFLPDFKNMNLESTHLNWQILFLVTGNSIALKLFWCTDGLIENQLTFLIVEVPSQSLQKYNLIDAYNPTVKVWVIFMLVKAVSSSF